MAEEKHGRTLFVRNIPYSATNESLEKVFSDIGPIKSCFVVKDKESGKCRGFGYVKFTLLEDAEKAHNTVKKIEGRNVHIVYANKKEKKKRFGQPQNPDKEQEQDAETLQESTHDKSQQSKKQKKGAAPVKGQKQAPNPLNEGKRARLIIRNLSFKCTKEELTKTFENYGDVVEVHIPKKDSGKRLGFGFVQFKNRTQAGMAVKEFNGKEICGRVVAVDWALPKDKFEAKLAAKLPAKDAEAEEQSAHDESMELGSESAEEDEDKMISDHNSVASSNNEDSSSSEEEEEQDSTEEDSDTSDDEKDKELSDDDSSGESDDDVENKMSRKGHQQHRERESDVNEGRTVFVRNLPYTIENEELEEFFSQYGAVKYARAVVDKISGMPKGSAFVQFLSKEAADSCVEAGHRAEDSGLSLGGRNLLVSLAVSRNQAGEFSEKKDQKKEQKDTRNLYLAREGMIRPGTAAAAKDVTPADLALRMKIDATKRLKLKDQNVFVSSTRLCVHNIPPTVSDQELRKIVLTAAGDGQAKLVECRIMRDLNRLNSQGVGKSRGFAFCAFTQHEHALSALQHLNNNPDIFGDKKRPIVEFSLENRKALEAKQKRVEKSRAKLKQKAQESEDKSKFTGAAHKRKRKYKSKEDFLPLEQRKEQDKVARSLHKGPLGLPSHSGAKQRHKPRPSQQMKDKKKTHNIGRRDGNMANRKQQPMKEKPFREKPLKMKNSNKKRNNTDSFDKLVAAYKQKIMSSAQF
ncbi:hypothetical protein BsWGS_12238 [Bradybaena similaris]